MPGILISGPAGAAKSALMRDLLREAEAAGVPTVGVDFQSIVVALLALERGPNGHYPVRPEWVLPLAEYIRQAAFTGAARMEVDVIGTNSDGDPARREKLLQRIGPGAVERVVDPGIEVVEARLARQSAELGDLEADDFGDGFGDDDDARRSRGDRTRGGPRLSRPCRSAVRRWYGRSRSFGFGGGRRGRR